MPEVGDIVSSLAGRLREGDRVAILSNGGFGGIHERLLAALRKHLGPDVPGDEAEVGEVPLRLGPAGHTLRHPPECAPANFA